MSRTFRIRRSRAEDLDLLLAIEAATAPLFAPYGLAEHFAAVGTPPDSLAEGHARGSLWVAEVGGRVAGFALASELDGMAHLEEIDVHPGVLRRGLGSALLAAALGWAEASGYGAMTLLTLRDVPWHVPFYRRHGFRVARPDELSPGLAALLGSGDGEGVDPERRVVLLRDLGARILNAA